MCCYICQHEYRWKLQVIVEVTVIMLVITLEETDMRADNTPVTDALHDSCFVIWPHSCFSNDQTHGSTNEHSVAVLLPCSSKVDEFEIFRQIQCLCGFQAPPIKKIHLIIWSQMSRLKFGITMTKGVTLHWKVLGRKSSDEKSGDVRQWGQSR